MADLTTILAQDTPDYSATILAVATLFTSIVGGIIALGSWISSLRNKAAIAEVKSEAVEAKSEAVKAHEVIKSVAETVDRVETHTNGLNEKLRVAEKVISKAEGKVEERAEVAERADAQATKDPAEVPATATKPPK